MTCAQVRHLMYALDRAERRDVVLAGPLRNHLEACDSCAETWTRVQRLDRALDGLRDTTAAETPASDSEHRLIEAFRAAQAGHAAASSNPSRGWTWVTRPWIARAAAVIAAFALGSAVAIYRHGSTIGAPRDPASPARALAVPRAGGAVQAPEGLAAAAPGAAEADIEAALDPASDFVVLPYGPPTIDDTVHLVQVSLPRQTLLDFSLDGPAGLALPTETEDVVAIDVLVDEFGNARAIRLAEPADEPSDLEAVPGAFD
jgi:hypothetical protein